MTKLYYFKFFYARISDPLVRNKFNIRPTLLRPPMPYVLCHRKLRVALVFIFYKFFFFKSLNHVGQYCPYWYVIHKLDRLSRSLVDSFLDINYKIRVRESGVGATRIQGTN